MLKSYLPSRYNTLACVILIILLILGLKKIVLIFTILYLFIYLILRKNRNDFRDDQVSTKGVIFSPINGKVLSIEHGISHGVFGEQLVEIQLMIPWWKEMGIYLPLSAEIRNLTIVKGESFFRWKKFSEYYGTQDCKGILLELENNEDVVGLVFYKCKAGLWPELMVTPGDRGSRRVNIGFFPFGGTVMLYLSKKYEILIKNNDEVNAGESIIAFIPEHEQR